MSVRAHQSKLTDYLYSSHAKIMLSGY